MLDIVGKIFGSGDVVSKGLDLADAAFYTNQEKADWRLRLLKAYEPFKLGQRLLAMIIGIPYVLFFVVTGCASFFVNVDTQMALLTDSRMAWAFVLVNGFYFGGGAVEGIVRAKQ